MMPPASSFYFLNFPLSASASILLRKTGMYMKKTYDDFVINILFFKFFLVRIRVHFASQNQNVYEKTYDASGIIILFFKFSLVRIRVHFASQNRKNLKNKTGINEGSSMPARLGYVIVFLLFMESLRIISNFHIITLFY